MLDDGGENKDRAIVKIWIILFGKKEYAAALLFAPGLER